MGFETLVNIIKENKEQMELTKEEAMNPIKCPVCSFTLDENSKGEKSCIMCGWIG